VNVTVLPGVIPEPYTTGVVSPGRTHPGAAPLNVAAGATLRGAEAVKPRKVAEIVVAPGVESVETPMGNLQGEPRWIVTSPSH
jgi:hypothetical protein